MAQQLIVVPADFDPINKEAINSACDTCNGQFFFQTENDLFILGITKTFIGNMGHNDYSLQVYGYIPEHEARLTCWLQDTLIDECSATGKSYLDIGKAIRVEFDAKKYKVKSTFRSGINILKVITATLTEIKN